MSIMLNNRYRARYIYIVKIIRGILGNKNREIDSAAFLKVWLLPKTAILCGLCLLMFTYSISGKYYGNA